MLFFLARFHAYISAEFDIMAFDRPVRTFPSTHYILHTYCRLTCFSYVGKDKLLKPVAWQFSVSAIYRIPLITLR